MKYALSIEQQNDHFISWILLGENTLDASDRAHFLKKIARRFVVVLDQTVEKLYRKRLEKLDLDLVFITIPPGEQYKTRQVKAQIEDEMFKHRIGRDCGIIAMGGGVVTDMAGFVAATYCRGLPLVLIPTTLL